MPWCPQSPSVMSVRVTPSNSKEDHISEGTPQTTRCLLHRCQCGPSVVPDAVPVLSQCGPCAVPVWSQCGPWLEAQACSVLLASWGESLRGWSPPFVALWRLAPALWRWTSCSNQEPTAQGERPQTH